MKDDLDMISFGMIADAGDARHFAFEALAAAQRQDFGECSVMLSKAHSALEKGRRAQTDLLFDEMNGTHHDVNVLLVHSEDHLMDASSTLELIEKMIEMVRRQESLEKRIKELERRMHESTTPTPKR